MSDTAKASRKWSDLLARRAAPGREGWFYAINHPRLRGRTYNDYLSGLDLFSWVRGRLACPVPRALEIGCGDGEIALGLMQAGWFKHLDAFDVAEGAIATAQARAAAAGFDILQFLMRDGNKLFLCRPEMHATYLAYAAWLLTQGHDAKYLARFRERDLGNRGLLFIPRLSGREITALSHGAVSTPATQSVG
jgi:SAM-dependent methyltransferase